MLRQYIPQAKVIIEYRNNESDIQHDWREEIDEPLFVGIDHIWCVLRARNTVEHHNLGPYIIDNEMVIREVVLNAIAHRDYRLTSEIVIKTTMDCLKFGAMFTFLVTNGTSVPILSPKALQ